MSTTIHIQANGDPFEIEGDTTLPDFLESIELSPERVVVERNRCALTPSELKKTRLADGDQLEIVRIVAGG